MSATPTTNPVRQQDAQALRSLLAALEGLLRGQALESRTVEALARSLTRAGLAAPDASGQAPSAGQITRVIADLTQRLLYALGEYDAEPAPEPAATAFTLRFPTQGAARACGAELVDALAVHIDPAGVLGWTLHAVYPDLQPDPGYWEKERDLASIAQRFGGRLEGSQGAPAAWL